MNSCDIHTVLTRIREHLDENDRLRLNFVLGDLNQISEEDVNELIKSFEEINCDEAVKLLKEYAYSMHETTPTNISTQTLLPDQQRTCDSNNTLINSNNTNINPVTIVLNGRLKRKHFFEISSMMTQKCLFLFIILSIILAIFVIISYMKITRLKAHHDKTKLLELRLNETIQKLTRIELLHRQTQFTEGKTCGCTRWCNDRGSSYGACGEGHTCICTDTPMDKDSLRGACSCDSWCRKQGYRNGGICGDGYTCICSKD